MLCFVARRSLKILGAGRIRRGKQGDRNQSIYLVYLSLVDFEYIITIGLREFYKNRFVSEVFVVILNYLILSKAENKI